MAVASRRGLSLVETTIAVLLLGLTLVAALQSVGATAKSQIIHKRRAQAVALADALLAEIAQLPYEDPTDGGASIGLDTGESAGDRTTFDDIDDYEGWSGDPPVDADGNAIDGASAFRREVKVKWKSLTNPNANSAGDQGLKEIEVKVYVNNDLMVSLTALRSRAGDEQIND
mgnify:CR=1 FL=1